MLESSSNETNFGLPFASRQNRNSVHHPKPPPKPDIAPMNRIKAPHSAEISIKNSKFIAYLFPITDVAEAETRLAQVKREHPKARHWCYAYRLGAEEYRCNDDGEPSGTAGLPIYQQLLSFDVSDSLAVVVRYFGGILLGTGGLIKAYKESTRAALQTAELEALIPQIIFRATADYAQMSTLYNYCQCAGAQILEQEVDWQCRLRASVAQEQFTQLQSLLAQHQIQVQAEE